MKLDKEATWAIIFILLILLALGLSRCEPLMRIVS